jgi:hypothetical protein
MTHRAKVAWHKGNVIGRNRTRDNVEQETRKGRTLGKRQRSRQEGGKRIKDLRRQTAAVSEEGEDNR